MDVVVVHISIGCANEERYARRTLHKAMQEVIFIMFPFYFSIHPPLQPINPTSLFIAYAALCVLYGVINHRPAYLLTSTYVTTTHSDSGTYAFHQLYAHSFIQATGQPTYLSMHPLIHPLMNSSINSFISVAFVDIMYLFCIICLFMCVCFIVTGYLGCLVKCSLCTTTLGHA